jgi:polyhydroxybutyrate depolymerase
VTCTGQGLQPGDSTTPITFTGLNRNYILHVPTGYQHIQPIPLVVNIHAFSSDAPYQEISSNMNATADANGFAVAYPNSDSNSWNAGACCGASRDSNNDDVQFIRNVVADIKSKICVDASRIYVTGMSNGGFMSNLLGCKASDLFAAIAPVSGMLGIANEDCTPGRPVPVYYVHGDADPVVPFGGGSWLLGDDLMSANESTAGWVARNHCKDTQPDVTNKVGNTTCSTYHECDQGVEVTFCVVAGGGHCWPGMQGACVWFGGLQQGGTIPDLKGSDEIWKFFKKYSL